jgi:hypothetical protein
MTRSQREDMGTLLVLAGQAIPMLQVRLAKLLGVSSRTMRRWTAGSTHLLPSQLVTLCGAVHPKDPALAARIAAYHGQTLEGLGIVQPPPPPPTPKAPAPKPPPPDPRANRLLADALVGAAAEVADVSPRAMRPALAAMLERARDAGLTIETAHALLAPPTKTKGT